MARPTETTFGAYLIVWYGARARSVRLCEGLRELLDRMPVRLDRLPDGGGDRPEEIVDHVVTVADPVRHHHDGDHDRDERVELVPVLEVLRRRPDPPPGEFRGPRELLLVVPDREVRVVPVEPGQSEDLVLSHGDQGEVHQSSAEVLVDPDDVVQVDDYDVVVEPRARRRVDLPLGYGLGQEAHID